MTSINHHHSRNLFSGWARWNRSKIRLFINQLLAFRSRRRGHSASRFVFIVTYGRSGSTILMKLINAMNGFDIKGENNGAVMRLIDACRQLELGQERYGGVSTESADSPWYGIIHISAKRHAAEIRGLIAQHFAPVGKGKRIGGFKEIRYFQLDDPGFAWHIEFLLGFPDARIVFLTREAGQVKKSAWWKHQDTVEVEALIARMDRLFGEAKQNNPDCTIMVDYKQITQFEEFSRVAEFLGGTLERERYDAIIAHQINQSILG